MTALQIAEQRNNKKAMSELKDLQAWEESLCPVMKATRAEDYDRLIILIKTKGSDLHYRDANNGITFNTFFDIDIYKSTFLLGNIYIYSIFKIDIYIYIYIDKDQ